MRSGRLKHTILIERATEGVGDKHGTRLKTWAPVVPPLRAEILTDEDQAFLRAYGESNETAIVLRVRFRDGIEAGDRVTMDGSEFALIEIKEVVHRRVLELRCAGGGKPS